MGSVINDIETIKIANNLHNTQMLSLINTLQNNFDSITSDKKNLIMSIAKDYNLNENELIDRYINNKKEVNLEVHKPLLKQETKNKELVLEETKDEKLDTQVPTVKRRGRIPNALKKTKELTTVNEKKESKEVKSNSMDEIEVDSDTQKGILKYIKIRDKEYLLDSGTNEIFDTEHNKVGRKEGNKCILTKALPK
jgi:hypothetical protein